MPKIRYINIGSRKPRNPLVQALVLISGLVLFGVAVFVGGIILAGMFGLFLLVGLALYIRVWWLRSRFGNRRAEARASARGTRPASREARGETDFVEAEYRVIDANTHDDECG